MSEGKLVLLIPKNGIEISSAYRRSISAHLITMDNNCFAVAWCTQTTKTMSYHNVIVVVALTFLLASLTTGAMRHTNVRSITCNPNTRCSQNCPISNKCCCNNRIGVNPQCYNDATHDCVTVSGQQAGSFNCLCGQNSGCCQYTSPTGTTRLSCYSTQSHVCVVDSLRTGKYCLCPSGSPVCRNGGCSKATTPVCPVDAPVRCQSATGSSCVNLQSDEKNCGECGNECDAEVPTCCTDATRRSSCVNLQSDEKNCGECGNECGAEVPTCCTDATRRSTCVNLQSDENNCGECGKQCGDGENCVSGSCVTPSVVCPNDAPHFIAPQVSMQCYAFGTGCVSSPSVCCENCRTMRFTSSDGAGCENHPCDAYYSPNGDCVRCYYIGFHDSTCPPAVNQGFAVSYCMSSLSTA
jgi:hypothetical protein